MKGPMGQMRAVTGQAWVPEAVRDKGTARRRPPVLSCPAPTCRTGLWPRLLALGKRREHSVVSSPLSMTDFSVHLSTWKPFNPQLLTHLTNLKESYFLIDPLLGTNG